MTSATIKPASGAGGQQAEGRGYGLVFFAAIPLLVIGVFNVIYGMAAIGTSHVFTANAHYVIGDLRAWGWATLILAVLQLLTVGGILAGNQLARWFAVAVVGLNAIDMLFFLPAYPFWALVIIAVDVVALYGRCVYGSRENLGAVYPGSAGTVVTWNRRSPGEEMLTMPLHDRETVRDQLQDCVFADQDLTRPVAKYRFPAEGA
jgi:hypothetical protein